MGLENVQVRSFYIKYSRLTTFEACWFFGLNVTKTQNKKGGGFDSWNCDACCPYLFFLLFDEPVFFIAIEMKVRD